MKKTRLKRVLFIPDSHVPFEDHDAFNLMLRAGRKFKPDVTVIMGDFADCLSISSHSKDPAERRNLEEEIDAVRIRLAQVAALGSTTKVFVEGNHEERLSRYIADRAPELFGLVKIDELLHLDKLGFKHVPYRKSYRLGKLWVTHDLGKAGVNAHRDASKDYRGSAAIGHTHRMEYSVSGCVEGPPAVGAMFGWLGDFSSVNYVHAAKARREWVHGFGHGFMELNGVVHIVPTPIINGCCVVAGELIT